MTKTTMIAGLMLAILAAPVAAQDRGGPRWSFGDFDADGDGLVTREEVDAFREGRFAAVDADGDGSVTLEEFTAQAVTRATERAAEMFERLDADGDGALSRDVLESRMGRGGMPDRIFARLDADGDGAISEEEFEAAQERRAEMRGHGKRGGHGDGHGGRRN